MTIAVMDAINHASPTHSDLVCDLKLLRAKGLLRIRALELPALGRAAQLASFARHPSDPTAVELLLRRAVDALGDEEPGLAAQYLFGLVQGTVGRRPTDLRQRAAAEYGLAPETFRKEPERLLVGRIADEILRLLPLDPKVSRPDAMSSQEPRRPLGLGRDGHLLRASALRLLSVRSAPTS